MGLAVGMALNRPDDDFNLLGRHYQTWLIEPSLVPVAKGNGYGFGLGSQRAMLLAEEKGLDPGPELQQLEQAILRRGTSAGRTGR